MQKWKIINSEYLDYLRENCENRIPRTDYGKDKIKPFFGELFTVDNLVYVTQVSSPKDRHNNIKESIDFKKLYSSQRLISVVNLNYMFPVPKSEILDLEYSNIDNYVVFSTDLAKSRYIDLLRTEMRLISNREDEIVGDAKRLYVLKYDKPNHKISQRCFDYKSIEEYANKWHSV